MDSINISAKTNMFSDHNSSDKCSDNERQMGDEVLQNQHEAELWFPLVNLGAIIEYAPYSQENEFDSLCLNFGGTSCYWRQYGVEVLFSMEDCDNMNIAEDQDFSYVHIVTLPRYEVPPSNCSVSSTITLEVPAR